jgi:hypothetical protein
MKSWYQPNGLQISDSNEYGLIFQNHRYPSNWKYNAPSEKLVPSTKFHRVTNPEYRDVPYSSVSHTFMISMCTYTCILVLLYSTLLKQDPRVSLGDEKAERTVT